MNVVYRVVHGATRGFFRVYGRWKVIDHHKIPKQGPVIVACNHVSYVDPPLVGSAVKRECRFMARHDLFENKILGWLLPRLGSFPVNRDKRDRDAIKLGLKALEEGHVLVIFPEGGRTDNGELQRGEPGTALFVQKSGAPVVPTAVIGPEKMLPVGGSKLTRVPVKIVFGDPIQFPKEATRDEITGGIMRAIAKLLTEHGRPAVAWEDRPEAREERSEERETSPSAPSV